MMSDGQAEELRERLRELHVFQGNLAQFEVSDAPAHPERRPIRLRCRPCEGSWLRKERLWP